MDQTLQTIFVGTGEQEVVSFVSDADPRKIVSYRDLLDHSRMSFVRQEGHFFPCSLQSVV